MIKPQRHQPADVDHATGPSGSVGSTDHDGPSGPAERLRVLAVHAHPDDESLWTGLTLAKLARLGAEVQVVTCTLGEEGEVIGEKYQPLAVAGGNGMLGGYRIAELQRALARLGLAAEPTFLGGVGGWRDSGMADMPSIHHPRAFAGEGEHPGKKQQPSEWDQRLQQQVGQLLELLDQHQPDVLLTYGPDGGYGHPDHIRAHDITHAAARQWHARRPHDRAESADPAYAGPQEILWMVTEREVLASELERVDPKAVPEGWRYPQLGDIASVPADQVDFRVRGSAEDVAAKRRAMSAHATQLWVADGSMSDANPRARVSPPQGPVLFCLSNLIAQPLMSSESWTIGWRAHQERAGASMLQQWLQETETRAECAGADGCKGIRDREVRQ